MSNMNKYKVVSIISILSILFLELYQIADKEVINNSSKNNINEHAKRKAEIIKINSNSSIEAYIEAKKQQEYYKDVSILLKEYAIKEMESKSIDKIYLNGVYVNLYTRKQKGDSTKTEQIIKLSY